MKKIYLFLLAETLIEKMTDPCNAKEHYQSFIKKENTKSVKQKTFENPNIVHIKSIITKHPKTSHKLSKTIKQAEKQVLIARYIVIQKKIGNILNEKNVRITKREHVFKGFGST